MTPIGPSELIQSQLSEHELEAVQGGAIDLFGLLSGLLGRAQINNQNLGQQGLVITGDDNTVSNTVIIGDGNIHAGRDVNFF